MDGLKDAHRNIQIVCPFCGPGGPGIASRVVEGLWKCSATGALIKFTAPDDWQIVKGEVHRVESVGRHRVGEQDQARAASAR